MRKKYQIVLSLGILIILAFGFSTFIILSQKSMQKEITKQVLADNKVIGEEILKWIKKDLTSEDDNRLIMSIQNICNDLELPNGGFICALKPNGQLVAAPNLVPPNTMNMNIVNFIVNETDEVLKESEFQSSESIEGTLIYENGKRTDIVASLPIDMSDIRLNVHQNKEKITERVRKYIKPLVWLSIIISLFLTVLSYFVLDNIIGRYQLTIEKQHGELQTAFDEISKQKEKIVLINENLKFANEKIWQKNKNITDSIQYAKRIQMAVLPSQQKLDGILDDYFIYFKPKNVVSGDFYWIHEFGEKIIIGAVDCTGHGVPGAFMSILGMTLLDEIVERLKINSPDKILNELRQKVKIILSQEEGGTTDGMDMSLCLIDKKKMELEYAGAYNPIYIVKKGELKEIKANKMPIGTFVDKEKSFNNHKIPIQKNDVIYMFSDGYADQFGGEKGKKFKYQPFKEMLTLNYQKPMNEQYKIIDKNFYAWKGGLDQVDDILVIGIRI